MDTLTQIRTKRDKLAEERDRVKVRLQKIEDELRDLEIAASVVARFTGDAGNEGGSAPSPNTKASKILAILRSAFPNALGLLIIMQNYESTYKETLEKNTARVSLMRLKERGLVNEDPNSRTWTYVSNDAGRVSSVSDDTLDFLQS